MAKVFISYRREDTGDFWADTILMYMSNEFGARSFFKDSESIETGSQWRETLFIELEKAVVLLLLIGPEFFTLIGKSGKPRIKEKGDIVRIEISEAIRLGKAIIPVLLPQAKLPDQKDLPSDIRKLLEIEVFNLKKTTDINLLIEKLEQYIPGGALHEPSSGQYFVNRECTSADEICARATTQYVATLIELGWYLMLEKKKLVLLHPKFPSLRFFVKPKLAAIILERNDKNIWGQERWKKCFFFSVPTSRSNILNSPILHIAVDLRQAATNPIKYLERNGSTSSRKIRIFLRGRAKKSFRKLIVDSARRFSPEQNLKSRQNMFERQLLGNLKFAQSDKISFLDNQDKVKKMRRAASETAKIIELNRLVTGIQHKWLIFHPKKNILVVGGAESDIQIWNLDQDGKKKAFYKLKGHRSATNSGSFSDNGLLATASDDGTVRIWDVNEKRQLRKFQLFGIIGRLRRLFFCQVHCVDWSFDGKILGAVTEKKEIRLWNTNSWEAAPCIKIKNNASIVAFNPKENQITCDIFPSHIGIYDLNKQYWTHNFYHENTGFIGELDFSPDGKMLAAGGKGGVIFLYKVSTGKLFKTLFGHDVSDGQFGNSIRSIRFSPNGRWLASTSRDNFLIMWDMKKIALSTFYKYETWPFLIGEGIPGLAWSFDSRWLALPSADGEIQILELNLKQNLS